MKIVGKQNHSEFELNPQLAWQRGKVLDAMKPSSRSFLKLNTILLRFKHL